MFSKPKTKKICFLFVDLDKMLTESGLMQVKPLGVASVNKSLPT